MNYEALVQRLEVLEAERHILDVLIRYGHCIDYGDQAGFVECFTEDAIWEALPADESVRSAQLRGGRKVIRYVGREELRTFVSTHTRAPQRWHKHFLVSPRVEITGDTAHVVNYFLRIDRNGNDTGSHVRAFGRNQSRVFRCSDGAWRIAHMVAEVEAFIEA
jgi:3-phenylpropionate/cinnamic acid dioxygenase small subunit